MGQAVNHQTLITQALVQFQTSPCGIWERQRWKRLFSIYSLSFCQCFTFICHQHYKS